MDGTTWAPTAKKASAVYDVIPFSWLRSLRLSLLSLSLLLLLWLLLLLGWLRRLCLLLRWLLRLLLLLCLLLLSSSLVSPALSAQAFAGGRRVCKPARANIEKGI